MQSSKERLASVIHGVISTRNSSTVTIRRLEEAEPSQVHLEQVAAIMGFLARLRTKENQIAQLIAVEIH